MSVRAFGIEGGTYGPYIVLRCEQVYRGPPKDPLRTAKGLALGQKVNCALVIPSFRAQLRPRLLLPVAVM